ncbi:MAG TPA: response regulator [Terriglobales bacterium]|nr:response regulator [Terriglobales bacterium]
MRTLIWIDDHVAGVALRKPVLENCGYSVLTAHTAQEGLALISAKPVEAVILDCPLPDMDGEALVSQIRAIDSTLPIVVLTRLRSGIPEGVAHHANATFTKAHDSFTSVAAKVCELVTERTQKKPD